ncbi:MAG: hypothetical protein H0U59_12300 [Gemmatimonadaceae bacterium]|nr:hypothetical protein [Gemmatimonadaceae bacterium]
MKIFGREPTLWIAFIASIILLLGTLGFRWLDGDQAALVVVAVNGIAAAINAYTVRPISPAVFTYAVGAVVAVFASYNLSVSPETLGMLNGLVIMGLGLLTRGQVVPQETAISRSSESALKPEVDAT